MVFPACKTDLRSEVSLAPFLFSFSPFLARVHLCAQMSCVLVDQSTEGAASGVSWSPCGLSSQRAVLFVSSAQHGAWPHPPFHTQVSNKGLNSGHHLDASTGHLCTSSSLPNLYPLLRFLAEGAAIRRSPRLGCTFLGLLPPRASHAVVCA